MTDRRRALGAKGEDAVARWYCDRGYELLARNWRVREGELDLVLALDATVVFCEVKTRQGSAFGSPFEAVTRTKQRRLRGLAIRWLSAHAVRAAEVRFDVAAVCVARDGALSIDVRFAAF